MPKILRRLRYVFLQDRRERDLTEELRFHFEMKKQELEANGSIRRLRRLPLGALSVTCR